MNLSPNERQSTESRAVAEAWRAAVHDEMRAELHQKPTRPHRRRRDRLAARLLAEGERIRREMLP